MTFQLTERATIRTLRNSPEMNIKAEETSAQNQLKKQQEHCQLDLKTKYSIPICKKPTLKSELQIVISAKSSKLSTMANH